MTADPLRRRITELVEDSADEKGVTEPNAELLGETLTAVLAWADTTSDGVGAAAVRDVITYRLGVERDW